MKCVICAVYVGRIGDNVWMVLWSVAVWSCEEEEFNGEWNVLLFEGEIGCTMEGRAGVHMRKAAGEGRVAKRTGTWRKAVPGIGIPGIQPGL